MSHPTEGANAQAEKKNFSANLETFKNAMTQNRKQIVEETSLVQQRQELLEQKLMDLKITDEQREEIEKKIREKESELMRAQIHRPSIRDFEKIAIIGHGAFGIVWLVRKKQTGEVFALKQLKKSELLCKNQVQLIKNEKDALSSEKNSDWIAKLYYSFSDDIFLYLVIEYLAGGDLMTHLMRKDIFSEYETKFYIAEIVCAIQHVHEDLNYIHRDIKPDNILFDKTGHIKLLDFGLAKLDYNEYANTTDNTNTSSNKNITITNNTTQPKHISRKKLQSIVGTPDYMAPEIFAHHPYNKTIDLWSIGIIMYEMLYGGPPFSDEHHRGEVTRHRVLNWEKYLYFPSEPKVSDEGKNLLRKLLCDNERRMDCAESIKKHDWFKGFDFDNIKRITPPIIPEVESDCDIRNFDDFTGAEKEFLMKKGWTQGDIRSELRAFWDFLYDKTLLDKKTDTNTDSQVIDNLVNQMKKDDNKTQRLSDSRGTEDEPQQRQKAKSSKSQKEFSAFKPSTWF